MLASDILVRLLFALSGSLVILAGGLWWKARQIDARARARQSQETSSQASSGRR